MPGPRQDSKGLSYASSLVSSSTVTATIKFKTSATLLRTLFPNSAYRFRKTDTVALVSFPVQTLSNMAWLAGGSYDLLGFFIHDVDYTTQNGQVLHGSYCPVMFENLTDPILSGREELGYPKVFSDISISTGNQNGAKTCEARLSWRGAEWATFRWHCLSESHVDDSQPNGLSEPTDEGLLVHKCVPATGKSVRSKHRADAEYDVFIPSSKPGGPRVATVQKAEHAEFKIKDLGFNKLPTLHHIVSWLAEVPVFEIVEANIVNMDGVADLSGARRI
jgi:acetoacetate decarboxylase